MLCDATGKVLAVGRLHDSDDHTAQIRYMAVDTGYQRQGLGSRILEQLEQAAAAAGYDRIVLHARELAVPFYLSYGYRVIAPSHRLFGAIQHFLMSRELAVPAPGSCSEPTRRTPMADLFSVTAPLAIRFRDGSRQIMIERLPYRDGVLFLPPFWTESGMETALRFVAGPVRGDGPWKIGDAVVTVLGCHGTDAQLASEFAAWQDYLEQLGAGYPEREQIVWGMQSHAARTAKGDTAG